MIEPNCDMPWEIYLDWLQDQGNEDLRSVDVCSLLAGNLQWKNYIFYLSHFSGEGYYGLTDGEAMMFYGAYPNEMENIFSGYGADVNSEHYGCPYGDGCCGDYDSNIFIGNKNSGFGFSCLGQGRRTADGILRFDY